MSEDIVTAPSVNIFKGCFDKEYVYRHYCTRDRTIGPVACVDRKMMMMLYNCVVAGKNDSSLDARVLGCEYTNTC